MKKISQFMQPPFPQGSLRGRITDISRRGAWLWPNLTARKLANIALAGMQFALKHQVMRAWPTIVKIDISPLCNLHCTTCVHAIPSADSPDELKTQTFGKKDRMTVEQFQRIVDEIAGKTTALSLYYIGDPLMHPQLEEMCQRASKANLNTHISTNFSFKLTEERIERIVASGLTNLTVCVDGLTQEMYERTRVGGRVELVMKNLERVIDCKRRLGRAFPRVEVQYIKYLHNVDEVEEAARRFNELGVDQFTELWGDLHNYTDESPGQYGVIGPKKNRLLPQCLWPHFALQIKFDGDVIPCTNYRAGPQYSPLGERRVVGNVFKTSIWEVWNSPGYRALRRYVSNPRRIENEPALSQAFCDGCYQICNTEIENNLRRGDVHRWEDLYHFDERRRAVRKIRIHDASGT